MAKKKDTSSIPTGILQSYEALILTDPRIERKGTSMPYTSLNGHMFSFLSAEGVMGLRLPKDEREKFLEKYKTGLFVNHGIVLKEYVPIPANLFRDKKTLKKYLDISYSYAESLKPKPTKKKIK